MADLIQLVEHEYANSDIKFSINQLKVVGDTEDQNIYDKGNEGF